MKVVFTVNAPKTNRFTFGAIVGRIGSTFVVVCKVIGSTVAAGGGSVALAGQMTEFSTLVTDGVGFVGLKEVQAALVVADG